MLNTIYKYFASCFCPAEPRTDDDDQAIATYAELINDYRRCVLSTPDRIELPCEYTISGGTLSIRPEKDEEIDPIIKEAVINNLSNTTNTTNTAETNLDSLIEQTIIDRATNCDTNEDTMLSNVRTDDL